MQPIINEYRGNTLENQVFGNICVLKDKKVIWHKGDIHTLTFLRSIQKIVHSLPILYLDLDKKYCLTDDEIAIMFSSHTSESDHLKSIDSLLNKVPLYKDVLKCGKSLPINFYTLYKDIVTREPIKKIHYNNCIGKHLATILLCTEYGFCKDTYWDIENPIYNVITDYVKQFSEATNIKMEIDNCGIPNYAIPLKNVAILMMNYDSDCFSDMCMKKAIIRATDIMHAYHNYIDGSKTLTDILLTDDNIVAKSGAGGVYGVYLKKEKISIAIKLNEGENRRMAFLINCLLKKMNYNNQDTLRMIEEYSDGRILNMRGEMVGYFEMTDLIPECKNINEV